MGEKEDRRRKLKRRVFVRDGWQDSTGEWFVMCAFECGGVISWHTSSMKKKCADGIWTLDNTHLICVPCYSAGCNHKTLPKKRRKPRYGRRTHRVILQPKQVSVAEKIDRLEHWRSFGRQDAS